MEQRQGQFHQQPTFVHDLSIVQIMYVRGMTQNRAGTPLSLFKNKKTRQTYRAGKAGMHLAGNQKPLKDSVNLTKTQKEIKDPIKQTQKNSL